MHVYFAIWGVPAGTDERLPPRHWSTRGYPTYLSQHNIYQTKLTHILVENQFPSKTQL